MRLKTVNSEALRLVVRRFPHLETDIVEMTVKDDSFRQLCRDYEELISALSETGVQSSDTTSDLLTLRSSLEVEILEQVSRKRILKRN